MWPDRVSNPGPLTYESGALQTALRGLAPRRYFCFGSSCLFYVVFVALSVIAQPVNVRC